MTNQNLNRTFFIPLILLILVGCATTREVRRGDQFASEGNWEEAVSYYREALKSNPENKEIKIKLMLAEEKTSALHLSKGRIFLSERKADLAVEEFQRSLAYNPKSADSQAGLVEAMMIKESQQRFEAGDKLLKASKVNDAIAEFEKALELDPGNVPAQEALARLSEEKKVLESEEELTLTSRQPITLRFQNTRLKEVFELLSKLSGINILFDPEVKDDTISVFIKDAPFKQALDLLLATNKLFMKRISKDTIIIIPKTKPKMDQYQDLMIRTFYLSNMKAKDMVNLLRTMLDTKRVYVNEDLNAIVLRDTPDKVKLAEKIIEANDRKIAEVIFDVEILEVNRTKSQKYGWYFSPSQITAGLYDLGGSAVTLEQLKALGPSAYLFTLPKVVVDFMKQDSDAQTLANPRIRVVENKSAKVNIGDRVPILLSTTTTPVTGATAGAITTTTSIEYRDVGIKLTVEPDVHINNNVTLKLNLEVTSLGDLVDLGGGLKQYRFGTRSTETVLNLQDGEIVIIGGLIKDEERTSISKVPGLGDAPILGKLFSSTSKEKVKTDILLTITPHIIRGLETPVKELQTFWSGTEESYATKPLFIAPEGEEGMRPPIPLPEPSGQREKPPVPKAILEFGPSYLKAKMGETVEVKVSAAGVKNLSDASATVAYDPGVLELKGVIEGEFLKREGTPLALITSDISRPGVVDVHLSKIGKEEGISGSGVLFTLTFLTKVPGTSNLVLKDVRFLAQGKEPIEVEVGGGTVDVE